jgi:hypothetical protein
MRWMKSLLIHVALVVVVIPSGVWSVKNNGDAHNV